MSRSFLTACALLLASPLALAHSTATSGGLMAGLVHVLSGFDHLMSMLALGLWSATASRQTRVGMGLGLPMILALGMVIGLQWNLVASADLAIALGLVMVGGLIASRVRFRYSSLLPAAAAMTLASLFVLVNGVAHSEVFQSATSAVTSAMAVTFCIGLMLSSLVLMLAGQWVGQRLAQQPDVVRGIGALFASCGLVFSLV